VNGAEAAKWMLNNAKFVDGRCPAALHVCGLVDWQCLQLLDVWGPDIFHLADVTDNSPLTTMVYIILKVNTLGGYSFRLKLPSSDYEFRLNCPALANLVVSPRRNSENIIFCVKWHI